MVNIGITGRDIAITLYYYYEILHAFMWLKY